MGTLVTYQDIHVGAANAVMTFDELFDRTIADLEDDHIVVWNGDIFDLANCHKKDVNEYRRLVELWLKRSAEDEGFYKNFHYNLGNHCRWENVTGEAHWDYTILELGGKRYFITHGDKQSNQKKYFKYRRKKHGAGWLKRKLWVPALSKLEDKWERTPSDGLLGRCRAELEEHKCDVFVGGHLHCDFKKHIVLDVCAVTVMFFDQGRREIEI